MIDFKPQLQAGDLLQMKVSDPRHYANGGVVGFKGSFDHGGVITDFTRGVDAKSTGAAIAELGTKIGAESVMRTGSLGAAGLNRPDGSSFSDLMLNAIDKVSGDQNRVQDLELAAMTDPSSIDAHDLTVAQAEANMSLGIARTLLSRLTQAWKDIINTR
ncbi:MAG: hypothetical protein Ta2B_24810 [Termitinemataceae bacterium]|nr:MAG: hypothetical protein Ta2B_24810 [Termitinemataceae bacterium]